MQQQTTLIFRNLKLFPSLNKGLKEHFAVKMKRRETLHWLVKEQKFEKHAGRVKIRYQRYATHLQDWDNHLSSGKVLFDILTKENIIKDDNPNVVVEMVPEQYKVKTKDEEKIVVIITNIL